MITERKTGRRRRSWSWWWQGAGERPTGLRVRSVVCAAITACPTSSSSARFAASDHNTGLISVCPCVPFFFFCSSSGWFWIWGVGWPLPLFSPSDWIWNQSKVYDSARSFSMKSFMVQNFRMWFRCRPRRHHVSIKISSMSSLLFLHREMAVDHIHQFPPLTHRLFQANIFIGLLTHPWNGKYHSFQMQDWRCCDPR